MEIKGKLVLESPLYRGNARKTIFTRGNDQEIFLPGNIYGPAKVMMNAFTGFWQHQRDRRKKNSGLLEQLWRRLFDEEMPDFITDVSCKLDQSVSANHTFFDMRMGIAIDRDSMAQSPNHNFRLETLYRGTNFDFLLKFDENKLGQNKYKFACMLNEIICGRFWFGAQKSKGLGRCYLNLDKPSQELFENYKNSNSSQIKLNRSSNYIFITLDIIPINSLLVSWPWGKQGDGGSRDGWVDELVKETKQHQDVMSEVVADKVHSWSDIEKLPGGKPFFEQHQKFYLHQLKRNFPKAIENDQKLMDFLKGHREKVHQELDREPNVDFREHSGQVVKGKHYDQIFNRSLVKNENSVSWEMAIHGNTVKGAFRTKAQQILRTLKDGKGCREKTSSHQNRCCDDRYCPVCSLFGSQGSIGKVYFSDAYPVANDRLLDGRHCSMDQITIDPKTGSAKENTKQDALYAYGSEFKFRCELVIKDLDDFQSLAFLMYLLREFEAASIPLGGKKSLNFGYVLGQIVQMDFLCAPGSPLENSLKKWKVKKIGIENVWQHFQMDGGKAWGNNKFLKDMQSAFAGQIEKVPERPLKTEQGFISHRQYSKLCGSLICELQALTPLHVKESGEPSYQSDEVLGYDFFSMSPPENSQKPSIGKREYVIPPSTLKGAIKKIYNLISQNPCNNCSQINSLCDTCKLFGYVGKDGALMGRLTFSPAKSHEDNQFEWFGVQFGYKGEQSPHIGGYRIFPHTNDSNNAISRHGVEVYPSNAKKNITLNRYAQEESLFKFCINFTNLEEEELKRLIWSVELENGLGHKIGKSKALYFGSCKINIQDAFLIDWKQRFSSFDNLGHVELDLGSYRVETSKLNHYNELKEALALPYDQYS